MREKGTCGEREGNRRGKKPELIEIIRNYPLGCGCDPKDFDFATSGPMVPCAKDKLLSSTILRGKPTSPFDISRLVEATDGCPGLTNSTSTHHSIGRFRVHQASNRPIGNHKEDQFPRAVSPDLVQDLKFLTLRMKVDLPLAKSSKQTSLPTVKLTTPDNLDTHREVMSLRNSPSSPFADGLAFKEDNSDSVNHSHSSAGMLVPLIAVTWVDSLKNKQTNRDHPILNTDPR
ncbi:unnamed protein product [Lepeophtheirus salmonis]|uniref:(salmon louse) hypothetical protein n=1 Tax=Lepeophtheirus salmonis TaxID=72036 RepID=A0A817FCA6_LEPSM|nr:unnamed protein product [Lepeophtheirus salmonis]CAG9477501.1 unnamed protein product [Lepeophtheirus salmonis]